MDHSTSQRSTQVDHQRLPTCSDHAQQRRQIVRAALALGVAWLAPETMRAGALAQDKRTPTSEQDKGPFYPVRYPDDVDADLTRRASGGVAGGEIIYVSGRVVNVRGEPVANARVEIWQANAHGRYTHPRDANPAPIDPNFDGYARIETDAEGRYRFKTIKPGAYAVSREWTRPPHIHFIVRGRANQLVTQMYFPGDPLNDQDPLLQNAWARDSLIAQASPNQVEAGAQAMQWDVVLVKG